MVMALVLMYMAYAVPAGIPFPVNLAMGAVIGLAVGSFAEERGPAR
jgi:H+/Cl- antiporter ClcA